MGDGTVTGPRPDVSALLFPAYRRPLPRHRQRQPIGLVAGDEGLDDLRSQEGQVQELANVGAFEADGFGKGSDGGVLAQLEEILPPEGSGQGKEEDLVRHRRGGGPAIGRQDDLATAGPALELDREGDRVNLACGPGGGGRVPPTVLSDQQIDDGLHALAAEGQVEAVREDRGPLDDHPYQALLLPREEVVPDVVQNGQLLVDALGCGLLVRHGGELCVELSEPGLEFCPPPVETLQFPAHERGIGRLEGLRELLADRLHSCEFLDDLEASDLDLVPFLGLDPADRLDGLPHHLGRPEQRPQPVLYEILDDAGRDTADLAVLVGGARRSVAHVVPVLPAVPLGEGDGHGRTAVATPQDPFEQPGRRGPVHVAADFAGHRDGLLDLVPEGIQQVEDVKAKINQEISDRQAGDSALNSAKLDKAGGTISGDLAVQGKLTLDADDVADVAFDDWIAFTHWVQPCEGNSGAWENLGFAWKSVTDALGKTLYVPIRGIIGAELVSVDVGLHNVGAVSTNGILGFSTSDLANFIGGSIDFGEVTIGVNGSESVIRNVVLVDPQPPHQDLPFAFDLARPLWLRLKTGGSNILFTGARLNYRRKRVAV